MNRPIVKLFLLSSILAFSSCDCTDRNPGWVLEDTFDDPTEENTGENNGENNTNNQTTNNQTTGENNGEVETVNIVPDIPIEHALNERTALVKGDDGTLWLAYHSCSDSECDNVNLTLGQKRENQDWTFENVKAQQGTFGIEIYKNQPILIFLDPTDDSFKTALRRGKDDFIFETLPVRRTDVSDGLDIARDGDRVFVTFSNDRDPLSTFVLLEDEWRKVETLEISDASAAYERGLQADGAGNLFLVHQDAAEWGIAKYSLRDNRWTDRQYLQQEAVRPSSMVVFDDQICIASDVDDSYLSVSCGDMNNLERDLWAFPNERLSSYSSLFRGDNGTLYIAFNTANNESLRLAKHSPNQEWEFKNLFEKSSYGVSTAIDSAGQLVISYYTCENGRCSLEVLSGRQ